MKTAPLVATTVLGLSVAACSGPNVSGNTNVTCRPLTVTSASRAAPWEGSVFTIVMENHSRSDILGNPAAPFINRLAQDHVVLAGYHGPYVHPSEPNYLWMVAGENFGVLDDADPGPSRTLAAAGHVADQIERAGLTWKAYEEGMGDPCGLRSHDGYAAKHDPFVFFDDVNGWNGTAFSPAARCSLHVVDYSQLDADLASGSVPDYVFITPSLADDMHDGSVAQGDAWAAREIPKIMASPRYTSGGVLFLLWDEGSNDADDPPFLVASPNAKAGYVSSQSYDTSSYLLTVERLLRVDDLPCSSRAASVTPMDDAFTTALPGPVR